MVKAISKTATAVLLSALLVVSGAVAFAGAGALLPTQTGIVKVAHAAVKAKKKTFWRGSTATWTFYGVSKNKIKFRSSNKKVVKITKKGKITARKAGRATLTARYKGKLIGKYKIKVREAKKFLGTWKVKYGTVNGNYFSESDVKSGMLSGKLVVKKGGKAKVTLKGYDKDGNAITEKNTVKWVATSATFAYFGKDGTGSISGKKLTLSFDGGYLTLTK